VVGLSDPCGVGLSQNVSVCGANHYSVGWCGSECHSVQRGGGAIVKAPHSCGLSFAQIVIYTFSTSGKRYFFLYRLKKLANFNPLPIFHCTVAVPLGLLVTAIFKRKEIVTI
jgi:hypothetical protein